MRTPRIGAAFRVAGLVCLLVTLSVRGQAPEPLPGPPAQPLPPPATALAPVSPIPSPGDAASVGAREDGSLDGPPVFGLIGIRGYFFGDHVASNGVEFKQLFSLDSSFNLWLWRRKRVYLFLDSRFWGQKAAPGITNGSQGIFDFSKREFDFTGGVAWNYYGMLEARIFAYSFNNLNRGDSTVAPTGFTDGVGLENRYYLGSTYADLGTAAFDIARATFVSAGYYPTKDMVDGEGLDFKPGPFVRAYLTFDLWGERCYLYTDDQLIATKSWTLKLLSTDSGIAVRPFVQVPRLEFRLGTEDMLDLDGGNDKELSGYLSIRYIY